MVMVIGTSTCHMLLADRHALVEGIGGVVEDGIVEGFYGYEAGQPAVGDLFGWFAPVSRAAATSPRSSAKRPRSRPARRGLLALDWWNGNRSVLVDANLSGLLVGLTLSTTRGRDLSRPHRGDRVLDSADPRRVRGRSGSPCTSSIAVGGLAERSPLLLQVYADVTGRPIALAAAANASALGARHARRRRRGRRAGRPRAPSWTPRGRWRT